MAQGRSTEIITMIKWIRTSRLSIKNYLSLFLVVPSSLASGPELETKNLLKETESGGRRTKTPSSKRSRTQAESVLEGYLAHQKHPPL